MDGTGRIMGYARRAFGRHGLDDGFFCYGNEEFSVLFEALIFKLMRDRLL